jgi:bifunctional DNA-binding transcriptional regulator/antitoxin component of YhaV-PrlF toxin-antitoxin module
MTEGGLTSRVVTSLRGGQVTIPADFREALGIEDESLLHLTLVRGELRIRPIRDADDVVSPYWLKEVYDAFAPIREELSEKYSEEEINTAIDEAARAVRQTNA